MYGDTTAIRRLAGDLREQAGEIRTEADRLVARTDAAGWLGQAGDALRERGARAGARAAPLCGLHDDAADALDRHAREVERLQRLIEEIERRVRRLVEAARDRLDDLAAAVGTWADEWLDRFEPPPPGSRRWLDVEVPGL